MSFYLWKNKQIDRGDLKQNLSEKFVWAIAYGSCIGWRDRLRGEWIKQSGPIAASIGIVIGVLLMILIAVSYGELVVFPVQISGGAFAFSFLSFGKSAVFFSSWFLTFGSCRCFSYLAFQLVALLNSYCQMS